MAGLAVSTLWACGKSIVPSKNYVTRTVENPASFDALALAGSIDIEFRTGETRVEIYAPDNLIDLIEVAINNNTLSARYKKGTTIIGRNDSRILVWSPTLREASVAGSGDIKIMNRIENSSIKFSIAGSGEIECAGVACDRLETTIAGSGDIDVKGVECNYAAATISGSGDIELKGTVQSAKLTVSGSGDIDADDLMAGTVEANIAGSGDISCYAVDRLDASVSGSGTIKYKGTPSTINNHGRKGSVRRDD